LRGLGPLLALASAVCACTGPGPTPELDQGADGALAISRDGEPFTVLHWGAQPRPYLYPLCAPGGLPVTRAYPLASAPDEAEDHPHHTSLWFAHGSVNGLDFWHGSDRAERMVARSEPRMEELDDGVRVLLAYDWLADDDRLICLEERTWTLRCRTDANVLDASFTLRATDESLTLGDTKEGSFALRLHPRLRVEGAVAAGSLRSSEGRRDGEVWGQRARWVEATGEVEGQAVGVLFLDHPSNPRHPTWWHARTYGLLAANPFGQHDFEGAPRGAGDLTLAPGESLTLRYRLVLHTGEWTEERVEAEWRAWATR
jgi:hypothetical protein